MDQASDTRDPIGSPMPVLPGGRDELVDAAHEAVQALSAFEEAFSDPLVRSLVRQLRQRLEHAIDLTAHPGARRG
jgi:hypothetical protein